MLCSPSLFSLRSAGFQPASGQDGRSPRRGATPIPSPGRLGQAGVLPDESGLARLQRIVKCSRGWQNPEERDIAYSSSKPWLVNLSVRLFSVTVRTT